jgi:hypothetical protein
VESNRPVTDSQPSNPLLKIAKAIREVLGSQVQSRADGSG